MTPIGADDLGRLTRQAGEERVGFYACSELDGVVRVQSSEPGSYPKKARVQCRCEREHDVGISWRHLRKGEPMNAEVTV